MAWRVGAARDLEIRSTGSWGPEVKDKIFAWAGWPDDPQPSKARRAFLAYDDEAPELKGSYKLPFAVPIEGQLVASKEGLQAAARRLPQADLPSDVKREARRVIDRYFERMESKAYQPLYVRGIVDVGEEPERRVYSAIITTDDVDRYGTRINPRGGIIEPFLNYGALLYNHRSDFVVGRVVDLAVGERSIRAEFLWDEEDKQALAIKSKVDRGFIRGVSIGFLPLEKPRVDRDVLVFDRWELIEVSIAPVPANPQAYVMNSLRQQFRYTELLERVERLEQLMERQAPAKDELIKIIQEETLKLLGKR